MLCLHRRAGGIGALEIGVLGALLAIPLCVSEIRAAVPEGPLVFPFTGNDRVWMLEGAEDCAIVDEGEEFEAERCFELTTLVADARGRYQGTASMTFDGAIFSGELFGPARGRQKQRGNRTQVSMQVRLRGVVEINLGGPPISLPARIDLKCDGEISAEGALDAPCDLKLHLPGSRPTRTEIPLAATVAGGEWTVSINSVLPVGNGKLEGNATDSFGFSYQLDGKYDERRDRSKLRLKGIKGSFSAGARIDFDDLSTPQPEVGQGRAKFKLLGAKGRANVTTEVDE